MLFTMKRAFITGITGQDGSYLAELLLEEQDLAADGRLGDVKLLPGRGERPSVCDRPDDLKLP